VAVVFGIVGTLLGVVIGAFLTRWIDSCYERRREIQKAIASALVLWGELTDSRAGINVILKDKRSSGGFLFAGLEAWDQHREILLSVGMTHRDWLELGGIFRHLLEVTPSLKRQFSDLPEGAAKALESAKRDCEKGRDILEPFIVEGRIPFFDPDSIFGRDRD
jgi:hypothetical protein